MHINSIKKEILAQVFSCELCQISKNKFSDSSSGGYFYTCPKLFCKKGALKSFGYFTRKRVCWNPFFNEVAGLNPPA